MIEASSKTNGHVVLKREIFPQQNFVFWFVLLIVFKSENGNQKQVTQEST